MKIIELIKRDHNVKVGDVCEYIEPNVTEDSIFVENGEVIGFFIRDIANYNPRLSKSLSNKEFRSSS